MWCLPRRENSVRGVGRLSFRRTHKSSGNEGSSIVIETLPKSDSKTVSVDSNRQYDSGGLSSESRGNSLLFSVSSMQRNSVLVWDWRDKCLQFVIQTGGKQIYQGVIPY
jgi:hypothetical protein